MLGKAMLTMKRSSEDKNTPVRTIRAVSAGRERFDAEGAVGACSVSSVMQLTIGSKVS